MKELKQAIAAGVAIAVGAACLLSCENKFAGAFLFSVALFTICALRLSLYTGKVGYFLEPGTKPGIAAAWLGNLLGTVIAAILLRIALPNIAQAANGLISRKLSQSFPQTAILSVFCGIMMFAAVHNHNHNKSDIHRVTGIVLCVMAFIMCGFEHSIANMTIIGTALLNTTQDVTLSGYVWNLVFVTLGNMVGGTVFVALPYHLVAQEGQKVG